MFSRGELSGSSISSSSSLSKNEGMGTGGGISSSARTNSCSVSSLISRLCSTSSKPSSSSAALVLVTSRRLSPPPPATCEELEGPCEKRIVRSSADMEGSSSRRGTRLPSSRRRCLSASRAAISSSEPTSFIRPMLLQCSSSAISSHVLKRSKPSGSMRLPNVEWMSCRVVGACMIRSMKSGTCSAKRRRSVPR